LNEVDHTVEFINDDSPVYQEFAQ